jgi:hypothetical protein
MSDPREIAGLVLSTPGLVDGLAETLRELGVRDPHVVVVRSLVDLADAWPGPTGWAIDNDGEPYAYRRNAGEGRLERER